MQNGSGQIEPCHSSNRNSEQNVCGREWENNFPACFWPTLPRLDHGNKARVERVPYPASFRFRFPARRPLGCISLSVHCSPTTASSPTRSILSHSPHCPRIASQPRLIATPSRCNCASSSCSSSAYFARPLLSLMAQSILFFTRRPSPTSPSTLPLLSSR